MEIDKKLYEEIKEYCKLNGLKPAEYANGLLKKAFMEDKYGLSPFKRTEDVAITNKAFDEAVSAEIKRILADENKLKKLTGVCIKADEPDINGVVYTRDALATAVLKFNEENATVDIDITEHCPKMPQIDDIPSTDIPKNVAKKDDICDGTVEKDEPSAEKPAVKKPRKRQISVK